MGYVVLGVGLVLAVEGLAIALAPARLEDALALLARLSRDQRRILGLVTLAIGVGLVWAARHLGV
jgi:uncharacterized protein